MEGQKQITVGIRNPPCVRTYIASDQSVNDFTSDWRTESATKAVLRCEGSSKGMLILDKSEISFVEVEEVNLVDGSSDSIEEDEEEA